MTGWDGFAKYVGVQGVLAVMLIVGYIAAIFVKVTLPTEYGQIMTFILGFYFAKNGTSVLASFTAALQSLGIGRKLKG